MRPDRWPLPEDLCAQAASTYPLLADVLNPLILHELHSLLWTAPRAGDHGWNCRDHALIIAGLLGLEGQRATFRHGRCMFMQGLTEKLPPVGLGQELASRWGHTWLGLDLVGHLDLSPKLDIREAPWRPMRHVGLVGDEWWAEGAHDLVVCSSADDYSHAIAAASWFRDRARAIYLHEREEPFEASLLRDPFPWTHSPLSNKLKKGKRSAGAYLKFLGHLTELKRGDARPLATVSWNRAWDIIDARSEEAARHIEGELGAALGRRPSGDVEA